MNNELLNVRSETFVDDKLERCEKRCFYLFCGAHSEDPAFAIDLSINAFDDPGIRKKLTVQVTLNQIILEYCSDIFKNSTHLILAFKTMFNYSDLYRAPNGKGAKFYKKCL